MSDINHMEQESKTLLVSADILPSAAQIDFFQMTKEVFEFCQRNYPGIPDMARMLLKRSQNEYDNQVAIEGVTGSGKSMFTFCLICCYQFLHGRPFDVDKNICFIPNEGELKEEIGKLKKLDAYWIDEAIRSLDKKRWYNSDQIDLNHIVKTDRYKLNTIFYLIQRFAELTESFRNSNIFFRIYIIPHFAAVMYAKDIDKDIEDPWHTRINLQIKYARGTKTRYSALINGEDRLKNEAKLPNYVMHSLFPNLEEIVPLARYWRYFQQLRDESREQRDNKDVASKEEVISRYERKWRDAFFAIEQEFREVAKLGKKEFHDKYLKEILSMTALKSQWVKVKDKDREESGKKAQIEDKIISIKCLEPNLPVPALEVSH